MRAHMNPLSSVCWLCKNYLEDVLRCMCSITNREFSSKSSDWWKLHFIICFHKGLIHQREQVVSEHFDSAPLQAVRPGRMKRLPASDDSSPLMSLTAINSTLGSKTQHSPPPAALLLGLGFLYTPPLPAEGLELKLELWQWAMRERSIEQAAAIHSSGSLSQIHCNTDTGLGSGSERAC